MIWLDAIYIAVLVLLGIGVLAIEILNAVVKHSERPRAKHSITSIAPGAGFRPLPLLRTRRKIIPYFR